MSTGVLPLEELKHLINLNTGFFECSSVDEDTQMFTTSGNHDTAGMSGGNLQYNFGDADRLQELFLFMLNNHYAVCQTAFGANTAQFAEFENVIRTYSRADRILWADGFSIPKVDPNKKRFLDEPWKTCFGNLLVTPECKAKYYAMRDVYYWGLPYDLFRQLSCTSRMALASLFDLYINKGRYYPINLIQVDFEAIDADTTLSEAQKEAQKIYQLNQRGNEEENALKDSSSLDFDDRRNAMRDQGGNYYGLTYDPDVQFDMNQEPAISEKSGGDLNINLGAIAVDNAFLGSTKIDKVYLGSTLIGSAAITPYTTTKVPQTQFRTNSGYYEGIGAVTSLTLTAGQPLWIDVQNFVACKTYYTIDGTTPTTNSPVYTAALTFQGSCTLKTLTVSVSGVAEAVKTLAITIAVAPTTTISPTTLIQNTIPFTVTLTTNESGATIHYKIGTGADTVYSGPFTVNQTNVNSTSIPITYWSVGATATETQKTITYDTSGSIPATPTLTATAGAGKVDLSWTASQNATSFTIYRSTTAGTLGTWIGTTQYYATSVLAYSDTGLTAGTTYYYTIRASNYGTYRDSIQKSAIPTAAVTGYRYIRVDGYGEYYSAAGYTNTRLIELEIFSGGVNVLRSPAVLIPSSQAVATGAEIGSTAPTKVTNADKSITANSYNIWWSDITLNNNAGNGWVLFDLGSTKTIDSIRYWAYPSRSARFKIYGSNNAADFGANGAHGNAVLLWDMSLNNGTSVVGATAGTNNYHEKIGGF